MEGVFENCRSGFHARGEEVSSDNPGILIFNLVFLPVLAPNPSSTEFKPDPLGATQKTRSWSDVKSRYLEIKNLSHNKIIKSNLNNFYQKSYRCCHPQSKFITLLDFPGILNLINFKNTT